MSAPAFSAKKSPVVVIETGFGIRLSFERSEAGFPVHDRKSTITIARFRTVI
jgi:hypothetical protein